MTVNALVAADRVIVPVQAEYLALEGLVQFLDTLDLVRRELNPALVLTGVVITMHDERTRLAQDVERELREHLPEQVFDTVIPRSVRVAEAPSFGAAGDRARAGLARRGRLPRAAPPSSTRARGRSRASGGVSAQRGHGPRPGGDPARDAGRRAAATARCRSS